MLDRHIKETQAMMADPYMDLGKLQMRLNAVNKLKQELDEAVLDRTRQKITNEADLSQLWLENDKYCICPYRLRKEIAEL